MQDWMGSQNMKNRLSASLDDDIIIYYRWIFLKPDKLLLNWERITGDSLGWREIDHIYICTFENVILMQYISHSLLKIGKEEVNFTCR